MPGHARIRPQLEELIEKHRDSIIKNTVSDQEVQQQLISINKAIQAIRLKDPSVVAAWGLGCGGHCLASPTTPGEL